MEGITLKTEACHYCNNKILQRQWSFQASILLDSDSIDEQGTLGPQDLLILLHSITGGEQFSLYYEKGSQTREMYSPLYV
jgi:hypothetical protein